MLTDWTTLDKTALLMMVGIAIWFIKYLLSYIKDIFMKPPPVVAYDHYTLNEEFAKLNSSISTHNTRIEHMEKTIESLLKERCCPVHEETVKTMDDIRTDIKDLKTIKSDISEIKGTLTNMREMGAIHNHPK
jgi:SPX domain protein involved in polyphosphate accumulation